MLSAIGPLGHLQKKETERRRARKTEETGTTTTTAGVLLEFVTIRWPNDERVIVVVGNQTFVYLMSGVRNDRWPLAILIPRRIPLVLRRYIISCTHMNHNGMDDKRVKHHDHLSPFVARLESL
jgi:hypothetical protein